MATSEDGGSWRNDPDMLRSQVEAVLEAGFNADGTKSGVEVQSLHAAARKGDASAAKALLDSKCEVDVEQTKDGVTPLMFAASWGHIEVANVLLSANADVNHASHAGDTALLFAASGNHPQIAKTLLEHRANVNHQASGTETAALLAVSKGNTAVLGVLLEGKADVNIRSQHGIVPLHYASRMGHTESVSLLISANADLEARQSENQWTSMMDAAHQGKLDAVKRLLDSNADPNALSKTGRTALKIAESAKHNDVVQLLQPFTTAAPSSAACVQDAACNDARRLFSRKEGLVCPGLADPAQAVCRLWDDCSARSTQLLFSRTKKGGGGKATEGSTVSKEAEEFEVAAAWPENAATCSSARGAALWPEREV
eukprot:CAMPEP_0196734666 /NCGR_PEP_ID=MMETSP1091-20130531/13326_1 /TAXON_ID=302021 /ORGANISM="Rhodomonas sp., Strain CCMP768" /LENGTH=369 /DNA_ID=CAMNT_0042078201 /DNA_START=39 /DNA_END=1147 /DNA_ORIENTATION=-